MKFKWLEISSFVLGLIGAAAWLSPYVYDSFNSPEVKAKILGFTFSKQASVSNWDYRTGKEETINGIGYYPKLAFTSLNKNFNVKSVEIFAKYPNDPNLYKGKIFWASSIRLNMMGPPGHAKQLYLKIPPIEHISSLVVIERDRVNSFFIPFIIDKSTFAEVAEIEIHFFDFGGKCQIISLRIDDLDRKAVMFEDKYFSEVQ